MIHKKSIALFDIDKTIFNQHSFFPASKFLIERGLFSGDTWPKIDDELNKYNNKVQTYSYTANKLLNIFGEALSGKNYVEVLNAVRDFFNQNQDCFYEYFRNILPILKQTHEIYLVTTNSQMFAEAVKEMFGLDGYLCTNFEVVGGVFTGKTLNSLADGKHVVEELLSDYEGKTMAFGDSENDIGMLENVSIPICINPTPELLSYAQGKGWNIVDDQNAYQKVLNLLES